MLHRLWALVALTLFACGAPSTKDSAPSCDHVGDKLLRLAVEDNGADDAPPELEAAGKDFIKQCKETPWSKARRERLMRAEEQEATISCPLN